MSQLVYVSAFLDIGREGWKQFKRTYYDYLNCFQPILNLFLKSTTDKFKLLLLKADSIILISFSAIDNILE